MIKELGFDYVKKSLGITKKQLENWTKGTGYTTRNDVRRISTLGKQLFEGRYMKAVANIKEEARHNVGDVSPLSPKAFKEAVDDLKDLFREKGPGKEAQKTAQEILEKMSLNQRLKFMGDLKFKDKETPEKMRNWLIVQILRSMGIDPHQPETYIHAI